MVVRLRPMDISVIARAWKQVLVPLLGDLSWMRFARLWLPSFLPGHSPLRDQVPWVTYKAMVWLQSHLGQDMVVFEYGAGGSTLFFAKKVKRLISVEHDSHWHGQVAAALARQGISNCELLLCEPERNVHKEMPPYGRSSYTSTAIEYAGMSFEGYVRSIDRHPPGSFDLVFVDGRARASCIAHAIGKVRPGGHLMLDNSERPHYADAIGLLAGCKRTDFFGVGPGALTPWQTSIWQMPR